MVNFELAQNYTLNLIFLGFSGNGKLLEKNNNRLAEMVNFQKNNNHLAEMVNREMAQKYNIYLIDIISFELKGLFMINLLRYLR